MGLRLGSIQSEAELEQVFDVCDAAFSTTSREYFVASVRNDPDWEPWQTRVLVEDGRVLSTVQIFSRQIRIGQGWVRCGGVGNVATLPAARGRGFASRVMQDVLDALRSRGYPVSVLFTSIHPFYARFGYRKVPMPRWRFQTGKLPKPAVGVREVGPDDLPTVRHLHERDALQRPIVVRRNQQRWAVLDKTPVTPGTTVWLMTEDGQGYIRVGQWDDRPFVFEVATTGDNVDTFDALLAEAFRRKGSPELFLEGRDVHGTFAKSRYLAGKDTCDDLMMAVLDEQRLTDEAGLRSVGELKEFLADFEQNGVTFWRSDFF